MEPSIAATLGGMAFWLLYGGGCCRGVFNTGVKLNWDQGYWLLYSRWLLLRGGRYREVPLCDMYPHSTHAVYTVYSTLQHSCNTKANINTMKAEPAVHVNK